MHSETQIQMKIHILAFANGKYRVFCLKISKVNLQHFLVYFQPPYVPKAKMRLKTEFCFGRLKNSCIFGTFWLYKQ